MENNTLQVSIRRDDELVWFIEAGLNFSYDLYRHGLNYAFMDLGIGFTFHQLAKFVRDVIG